MPAATRKTASTLRVFSLKLAITASMGAGRSARQMGGTIPKRRISVMVGFPGVCSKELARASTQGVSGLKATVLSGVPAKDVRG
jgi:hypothetical protein